MVELKDHIWGRRINRGMTREDLAAKVGCDAQTIGRWERGERPSVHQVPLLRQALEIPMAVMDDILVSERGAQKNIRRIEGAGYVDRVGTSFRSMFEEILALDDKLIGTEEEYVYDLDRWATFLQELPYCWRNITIGDEIVANWQLLPLTDEAFEAAKNGKLSETDLCDEHIQSLDFPGNYHVYLAALVCKPEYRFGRGFQDFFNTMLDCLLELAKQQVFFDQIVCYAWTDRSAVMCDKFGMKKIGKVESVKRDVPVFHCYTKELFRQERLSGHHSLLELYEGQ